jgi:hypothetical protein
VFSTLTVGVFFTLAAVDGMVVRAERGGKLIVE